MFPGVDRIDSNRQDLLNPHIFWQIRRALLIDVFLFINIIKIFWFCIKISIEKSKNYKFRKKYVFRDFNTEGYKKVLSFCCFWPINLLLLIFLSTFLEKNGEIQKATTTKPTKTYYNNFNIFFLVLPPIRCVIHQSIRLVALRKNM
jgi:hypothetical protein